MIAQSLRPQPEVAMPQPQDPVAALSSAAIPGLTTAQTAALTTAQVAALKTTQLAALTTTQVAALQTADVAALSVASVSALTTAQTAALTTAQIVALTTLTVAALTTDQIVALDTRQIMALETRDVAAMGRAAQIGPAAPFFVDAGRPGQPGAAGEAVWPRPGLTVVRFSNSHLVYALTWYGLALMVVGAGWAVAGYERRQAPACSHSRLPAHESSTR